MFCNRISRTGSLMEALSLFCNLCLSTELSASGTTSSEDKGGHRSWVRSRRSQTAPFPSRGPARQTPQSRKIQSGKTYDLDTA